MGKQFTSDFNGEERCAQFGNTVNEVRKFFWFHNESTLIRSLFTADFRASGQAFTRPVDAD